MWVTYNIHLKSVIRFFLQTEHKFSLGINFFHAASRFLSWPSYYYFPISLLYNSRVMYLCFLSSGAFVNGYWGGLRRVHRTLDG